MPGKAKSASLLDKYREGQIAEWSVYVCGPRPIDIGGVRAFNPGDAVPASHVTRGVVSVDDVIQVDDADGMASLAEAALTATPDANPNLPGSSTDGTDPDTLNQVKRTNEFGE